MTLTLCLTAALLAAEPNAAELSPAPPLPPMEVESAPPPAARGPAPEERMLSAAVGVSLLRYGDIPVTLATVRAGITTLGQPGSLGGARVGIGLFAEAVGGRTENGLRTGGFVLGPHLLVAASRVRASAGMEFGVTGVRRATDDVLELLATGILRGTLEADLWQGERHSWFVAATGTYGGGNDVPFRGWAGLIGVRL